MKIELQQGSLTDGHETVLVNASNTNGQLGSGVSGAIRQACGPRFQAEILEALQARHGGPMRPGGLLVTTAGAHPTAKWVVHVAVMDYREGFGASSFPSLELIRTSCERLWDVVETLPDAGPHSVAMVALGAGTGNLGVAEPTRIAAETLKAHLAIHTGSRLERVAFYGFLIHEYLAMAHALVKVFPELRASLPADVQRQLARP